MTSALKSVPPRSPLHFSRPGPLERLRKVVLSEGCSGLGDAELLALALRPGPKGSGAEDAAKLLLERMGTLPRLTRARARELNSHPEVSSQDAVRLAALFELGRRAALDESRSLPPTPLNRLRVEQWARPRLVGLGHEEVWVLCVNSESVMTSAFQVARGGTHGCALLMRDVLTPVVREGASGFVLVHNHPSGDPTPSREDIELTASLVRAAEALAIPLLDHVVVAGRGSASLFETGALSRISST